MKIPKTLPPMSSSICLLALSRKGRHWFACSKVLPTVWLLSVAAMCTAPMTASVAQTQARLTLCRLPKIHHCAITCFLIVKGARRRGFALQLREDSHGTRSHGRARFTCYACQWCTGQVITSIACSDTSNAWMTSVLLFCFPKVWQHGGGCAAASKTWARLLPYALRITKQRGASTILLIRRI